MEIPVSREWIGTLAREAGEFALSRRDRLTPEAIHAKGTPADLVTEVDCLTEKLIRERVAAAFPDHGFFGEEYGVTHPESPFQWIVDPIDGTTNYIHGLPTFTTSIGLWYRGIPVAAAVYAPVLGELFTAIRGEGAECNGKKLHVSNCAELGSALMATGFACLRAQLKENNLPAFNRIAPIVTGVRRYGSAALDLCYTAAGRFDGYWELALGKYDIAAGVLILTEAGGKVTDHCGGNEFPEKGVLASNGLLHTALLEKIQGASGPQGRP